MPSRVLLIDDDELVSRVVKRVLIDFEIAWIELQGSLTAQNVIEADWDLLILDLHMPSISGLSLLEAIQNKAPHKIKSVMVLSGDRNLQAKVVRLGARFCAKPIQIDEFQDQILDLIPKKSE